MSKGGSSPAPAPTTSTVNQSNLPDYAEPYFTGLLDRTEDASLTEYTPYEGQRIAEPGADTLAGFQQIRDQATAGTPGSFTTAENTMSGIAQGAGAAADYSALPSFTDTGVASQYMNPYITNVLDVQKARANQRFDELQVGRENAAMQAGAFGGDRRFVQDAIADRERNMQLNEMEAQGLAQAYQSGADIFGQEQGRTLQNRALASDAAMQSAKGLQDYGVASDALAFNRGKTLAGVGGVMDEQEQAGLDMAYSDFLNQRDYDRNQLNFYSGILRGVPISPTQESTTYNAPPSQMSQLLGLGVGGLGLAKAFNS